MVKRFVKVLLHYIVSTWKL